MTGHLLLIAGSFGFGIASALIPIINAEAYVLAVCATAGLWPASFSMVALVLGTLVGKLILFMGARHRDRLGRLLGRHSKDVTAAEEHVARLAREAEAVRQARHHELHVDPTDVAEGASGAVPSAEPVPMPAAEAPAAEPASDARTKKVRWPVWMLRLRRAIVDWGDRALAMLDHPWQSFIVLMTSASLGVPPLAVTTIAAGMRKTKLPIFIFCVIVGRSIRFGVIAVPTLMARF